MKRLFSLLFCIILTVITLSVSQEVNALDYYSSIDFNASKDELFNDLGELITDTHNYKAYGSSYNAVLAKGAATSPGASTLELFYTGYIDTLSNAGGGSQTEWNKEHVWPKSQTGGASSKTANDIHNIRPTNTKINSTRSSKPFGECNSPSNITYGAKPYGEGSSFCYTTSSLFEPRDEVKGDVARIIFYDLMRYPHLNVSTVGSIDLFLKWHYQDPVSQYEININDAIKDFQGNRNPYIDHPQIVDVIYPNDMSTSFEELDTISIPTSTSTNITLPSKAESYPITWTSSNTSVISNTGVITQSITDTEVTLTATITKDGKVGSKKFKVTVLARELKGLEAFLNADINNSLIFDYSIDSSEQLIDVTSGDIINDGTFFNFVPGTNHAAGFGFDDTVFGLYEESKTGSFGVSFYKTDTMTIKPGAVAKLECFSGDIKSITINYTEDQYGGTLVSTTTTGGDEALNGVSVSDLSSNVVYLINNGSNDDRIESIEISYVGQASDFTIDNLSMRFAMKTNSEIKKVLDNADSFGIIYSMTTPTTTDFSTITSLDSLKSLGLSHSVGSKNYDDYVSFVFKNIDNAKFNDTFYTAFYVVIDGKLHVTKNHNQSVTDVAKKYQSLIQNGYDGEDLLKHKEIINGLANWR